MQRDPCHGSVGLRGVAPRLDASTPARQTLTKPEFRPRSPRAKRWIPALWQWEFVPVPVVADIRLGLQTPPPDGSNQSIIQGAHSARRDRKSTRLNSSHVAISYAVFCLKKKNTDDQ